MRLTRMAAVLAFALVAVLVGAMAPPARADDPPAKKDEPAKENRKDDNKSDTAESMSFTNDDLEQMFGPPSRSAVAPPVTKEDPESGEGDAKTTEDGEGKTADKEDGKPEKPTDPLELMEYEKVRSAERQQTRADTEAEIQRLETRVKDLEDRILRIRNPLLKRPRADMSPDELEGWNEKSNTDRLATTEAQLADIRGELAETRSKLGG